MNFKTTGILIALVVIVGAVWLLRPAGPEGETVSPEGPAATGQADYVFEREIPTNDVVRVEIERADERLVFEREPAADATGIGDWKMVEPLQARADGFAVNSVVRAVGQAKARVTFAAGAAGEPTAAEAGLDPPRATVTLVGKDGTTHGLEIGAPVMMSSDTYARVRGAARICVVDRDLGTPVEKKVDEFRDKRLLTFRFDDVTEMEVAIGETTYSFSKTEAGTWVIDAPVRAQADASQLRSLVMRYNGLRADAFVGDAPGSLAAYGFEPPYLRATITTQREVASEVPATTQPADTQPAEPETETVLETTGVEIGSVTPLDATKRYARPAGAPWVATVATDTVERLLPQLDELRDPRITHFQAADVTELRITTPAGAVALAKEDGRWKSTAGRLDEVETSAITDVLEALEDLQAVSYIDRPEADGAYGLDAPRATLTATVRGQVAPLTLEIGGETTSAQNAYVRRAGEPTVYVVRAAQAERLVVDPLALRARQIFAFAPGDVTRLAVQLDGVGRTLERGAEGAWTLTQPAEAPVATKNVEAVVTDLARLRAARIVARDAAAEYGLDAPEAELRFTTVPPPAATQPGSTTAPAEPAKEEEHVLRLSRIEGSAYAQREGDPYVFELDDSVYRTLTAELIAPQLFDVEARLLTRVVITHAGEAVELVRDGEKWVYGPERYLALDPNAVQDYVTRLTQLEAQRYTDYAGGDVAAGGLAEPAGTIEVTAGDGRTWTLRVGPPRAGEVTRRAALVEAQRVFLLRESDAEALLRGLDAFLQSEK